ncbi:MAG: nucleotidyltransferase domain-containing protein [Gemmatimonadota bacterium]
MVATADVFAALGLSPALGRIIRFYLARPEERPHQRALQRALDLGSASVQRELERLRCLGVLTVEQIGNRTKYGIAQGAREWRALEELASTSRNPVPFVRDALVDVEGILAAFVFGSVGRGTQREHSDIDLLVLEGSGFDRQRFYRQLSEVSLLLDREVNSLRYTPQDMGERLGDPSHPGWRFLHDVLSGEKIWVAGSSSALGPIAAAAGIPRDSLAGRAA